MSIGQQLLDVPMGDMIRDMALAIADAQVELDQNSIEVAEMMGGLKTIYNADGEVTFEDSRVFFGKEKMALKQAVELHNLNPNSELGLRIKNDLFATSKPANSLVKTQSTDNTKYEVKNAQDENFEVGVPSRLSLLELGFGVNFYQFVDTIMEVRLAISMSRESSYEVKVDSQTKSRSRGYSYSRSSGKGRRSVSRSNYNSVTTTNVNATYSSKYSYSAEGSSLLRTKLTPIPPPPILEERIRRMMDDEFGA